MGSLSSLLEGCQSAGDDGVARMRCPDGIMVAARTRTVGIDEPMYRAEAYSMAQIAGGRLVWDQLSVATEGPSGLVDRARALAPGEIANATLVGVVRSLGSHEVEEIWCSSRDAAGAVRCDELLGVVLAAPVGGTAGDAARDTTGSTENALLESAAHKVAAPRGAATLFGRALSLPTTCTARMVSDGGNATCDDGASLSWRRYELVEEAASIIPATLAALGDSSEGVAYPCTIAGERGRCEQHPRAAAGLAYVDGKPIAVLCLGVTGPRTHSLCKAVMVPTP